MLSQWTTPRLLSNLQTGRCKPWRRTTLHIVESRLTRRVRFYGSETFFHTFAAVFATTGSWFTGVGDPIVLLNESLAGLVDVCYRLGPILRATDDAAATDERFDKAWNQFKKQFDDAVTARIQADQAQGLIPKFDARPVAIALNRLDAYRLIEAFGRRPRSKPEPVRVALARIWISTLYGSEWLGKPTSDLVRT